MPEQIVRIKNKIEKLKTLDKGYSIFGSQKHRYQLNQIISIEKIRRFEAIHKIVLPQDYSDFLTKIGNGGAGPYYGLEPLENSLFDDLDYKKPESLLNPSKPFVHEEPWNLVFTSTVSENQDEDVCEKKIEEFEKKYFSKEQMNGTIAICNYGCAVIFHLVVNGKEYGNIWIDDRASHNGIYPYSEPSTKEKITFLNWYELWLDNSLQEINAKSLLENSTNKQPLKKWWKFWK